jgi:hypothetical protein
VGLMTGCLFLLTFMSIVLSMLGAPSDERSGLSFVIVIVRPLLVNIYRLTCNVHVSYKYIQYVQGLCQSSSILNSLGYLFPTVLLLLHGYLLPW